MMVGPGRPHRRHPPAPPQSPHSFLPLPVAADIGVTGAEGHQETGVHRQHHGPQHHPARRDSRETASPSASLHSCSPPTTPGPGFSTGSGLPSELALHSSVHRNSPNPGPRCSPSTSLCQGETEAQPLSSLGGPTQPYLRIPRHPRAASWHYHDFSHRTPSRCGVLLGRGVPGVLGRSSAQRLPALAWCLVAPFQPISCLFPVAFPGSIDFLLNPARVRLCRGGSGITASLGASSRGGTASPPEPAVLCLPGRVFYG